MISSLIQSMIVSGKLALKLVEKDASLKYKPMVIVVVYQLILWYTEPLQTVADSHHEGYKLGQQLGDTSNASMNLSLYNQTKYLIGQDLSTIQTNAKDFIQYQLSRKQKYLVPASVSLYYHVIALREGLHILDAGRVDDIPTISEIETLISNVAVHFMSKVYRLVRAILFRHLQLGNDSLDIMNLSESIGEKKIQLRPIFAIGIFYEGLMCFLSSMAATDSTKVTWISRGQSILTRIRCWCEYYHGIGRTKCCYLRHWGCTPWVTMKRQNRYISVQSNLPVSIDLFKRKLLLVSWQETFSMSEVVI